MDSDRKLANAIVGKSARACDNCIKKRARWYCAADDAFLCQSCDSSVHSANSLSRRHERVRLKSASSKSIQIESEPSNWHRGFTRKARTPRQHKKHGKASFSNIPFNLVPEICSEDQNPNEEENEEQLLYRVPIFEPSDAELLIDSSSVDLNEVVAVKSNNGLERNILIPSEMDLEEFDDVDVESLLGKGFEESFNNIEGLGLLDCDENGRELSSKELFWLSDERVKDEELVANNNIMDEENCHHHQIDVEFELNFDYGFSPITGEEAEEEEEDCRIVDDEKEERISMMNNFEDFGMDEYYNKTTLLKLDYGGVMAAWDEHKSPWITGGRSEFISCGIVPDSLGLSGETGMMSGCRHASLAVMGDGEREARVYRYREKRRKRLFSKKIRYEVRKLNAEKRPRMKGRFVKRSNLGVTT